MIPLRTSLKKSKKRHAIAQAVLGGSGGLGWLWEPLGRSGGALEEIWEALIYKKTSKYSKTISILGRYGLILGPIEAYTQNIAIGTIVDQILAHK